MPTGIEWTDETWNPVRARLLEPAPAKAGEPARVGWHCEHVSPGCANCYAEGINCRLGTGLAFKPGHRNDLEIFVQESALVKPLHWRRPRKIFVCSMTDLFADFVSNEMIDRVFAIMALCPQNVFQVLTKRPDRMREYVTQFAAGGRFVTDHICRILAPLGENGYDTALAKDKQQLRCAIARCGGTPFTAKPLPNAWLGTSVEDQQRADERIPDLLATPAAVRFLSCEPLLGPVDISSFLSPEATPGSKYHFETSAHWVICGGESGPKARPMHPDWARSLRDQCAAAGAENGTTDAPRASSGVPFFFKQWGEWGETWSPDRDGPTHFLDPDGLLTEIVSGMTYPGGVAVRRKGKKAAGRLLDGVTHDGMPKVSA